MFVGAAENGARDVDPVVAKAKLDLAALAGFDTVRMTSIWSPGEREVTGDELLILRNAGVAARLDGIRLIVSVYQRDQRTTPRTTQARLDFAAYAASIAREVPEIDDFIVGNEPNLNHFWLPQFTARGGDAAAASYEALLAITYDAIKAVAPGANVIGGAVSPRGQDTFRSSRQTHSPTTFIPDLGAAYRRSGRRTPIMDMLAFHPYLIPSRLPPTFTNPRNTSIGISDYAKLTKLLATAFRGTGQPGATLPIVYDEFGYQSRIPATKRDLYTNLGTRAAQDAISEAQQVAQYRQAFAIAQCQPTVAGMLIFHVTDESDAKAWQSGVYYADGTPKTSLDGVRSSALAAQSASLVACRSAKVTASLGKVVFFSPEAPAAPLEVGFSCAVACSYVARVVRVDTGTVAAETAGSSPAGEGSATLTGPLSPGAYQYAFRAYSAGRPGTAITRYSRPFEVAPPPEAAAAAAEPSPPPDADAAPPAPEPVPPLPAPVPFPTLVPLTAR